MSISLERESINDFNDEQVSNDTLNILLASATKSNGTSKTEPKIITIQDKEVLKELEAALNAATESQEEQCTVHKAPVLVVASNRRDEESYRDSSEDIKHFVYLAHVLGLEFYRVNGVRKYCDNPQVREVLTKIGIPENHFVYSSIAFGYVGEMPQLKPNGSF